jgi:hypothetical protein
LSVDALHQLAEVRAESNYTLWIRFEDGLEGRVYVGNLVGVGMFRLWSDEERFGEVSIDPIGSVLCWGEGVELDADVLYHHLANRAKVAMH